jgi:DNA-binding SARP family transcriptional activator/tetratricopeptide (TPR) repeat protein
MINRVGGAGAGVGNAVLGGAGLGGAGLGAAGLGVAGTAVSGGGLEFRLLGPVELWTGAGTVALGPVKQRTLFVALLVDAGRVVPVDALIDRIWGDELPAQPRRVLHVYLTRARAILQPAAVALERRAGGYLLAADPASVDLHRFQAAVTAPARSAAALREALELCRGTPFAGLTGHWVEGVRAEVERRRLDAAVEWAGLALPAGEHDQVSATMRALAEQHPLDERVTELLMRGLAGSGRTAEALAVYAAARRGLVDELGAEPGARLAALHRSLLCGEPDRVPAAPVARLRPAPARGGTRPAQLPPAVPGFAGREAELAALDELLAAVPDSSSVVVISGTAGVGKTSLAVHWAHGVRSRFPDGQLYVNLRGFHQDGQVVEPARAVRGFLAALGVPARELPVDPDALHALYRSVLVDRRMLVVLDNARDADQVRPLLPGTPGIPVVVTSRDRLTPLLVTDGARPLPLDLLTQAQAGQLLARRLGADRVGAEPAAVDRIVTACARLPLALSIIAARARETAFPLAAMADELSDTSGRLAALDAGDPVTRIRAVFSWSYDALPAPARRLFRLLGLHPGPDYSIAAAASLAGDPRADRLLIELARASLLTEHAPGRYACHDLLAAYATELAHRTDPAAERAAALTRLLDHLAHTAHAADRLLHPGRAAIRVPLTPPAAGAAARELPDAAAARDWLAAEHAVLLAAVRRSQEAGAPARTFQLVWGLTTHLTRRGDWADLADGWRAAVAAAGQLGDGAAAVHAHKERARGCIQIGDFDEAAAHLAHALRMSNESGDQVEQGGIHLARGMLHYRREEIRPALHESTQAFLAFTRAAHRPGQGAALNDSGWYHVLLGDYPAALDCCRRALACYRDDGNRVGEANVWDSIGYAQHHLGGYADAMRAYQKSLELFRALGDRYAEARTLIHLADTQRATGDRDAARDTLRLALGLLTALDHPDADQVRDSLAAL